MKTLALGFRLQPGPFGGGNQFGHSFSHFLITHGVRVLSHLNNPALDTILVTETRPWLKSAAFAMEHALAYQQQHPAVPIVLRVNECDARKNRRLRLLDRLLIESARRADSVIFISQWLRDYFVERAPDIHVYSHVIRNGANEAIFNAQGYQSWDTHQPLKIVTHHWGAHWNKGFDVYTKLDELLGTSLRTKVHFTYIGNLPPGIRFAHTTVIPPLSGDTLARALKEHHVYLTASLYEPAGMHHIEGALCGLPLLYRKSGALPEYCGEFGISFAGVGDFEQALTLMQTRYTGYAQTMHTYPYTASRMNNAYYELLKEVKRRHHSVSAASLRFLSPLVRLHEALSNHRP